MHVSRLGKIWLLTALLIVWAGNFYWFALSEQETAEAPGRIVLGAGDFFDARPDLGRTAAVFVPAIRGKLSPSHFR